MKRLRFITGLSLVFCFVVVVSVHSQDWIINPDNGHEYAFIYANNGWETSNESAKSYNAYLVTITSQKENDWIRENILPKSPLLKLWIG